MAAHYAAADGFLVEGIREHTGLSGHLYVDSRIDRNFDLDPAGDRLFIARSGEQKIVIV